VTARTYELSPRDGTGVLLGLSGLQVTVLGAALVVFVALAAAGSPGWGAAIAAAVAGGALRPGGQTVLELAPVTARRLFRAVRPAKPWLAVLPLTDGEHLPPALAGQRLLAVDPARRGIPGRRAPLAVVHDRDSRRLALTIRAHGQRFALLERADQDRQVQLWADALAPFASDLSPVVALRWSEWVAPAAMEDQAAWFAAQAQPDAEAAADYAALVADAGPAVADHDVLLTLVVSDRTIGRRRSGDLNAAIDAVVGEARLFAQRLEVAGITVDGPLSPTQLREAVRVRLDPICRAGIERRSRTLGELAGVVTPSNGGPLAASASWRQWTVDDSLHRCFYVAEWPRSAVSADWLQGVLLHTGTVRTVAVTYEPVSRAPSRRRVERQVTKLATDADQRARSGFRVDASHQRASQAVLDREQELVAGFAEFAYVGMVDISASSSEELDRSTAELTQVAAAAGIELRPLHGRHDLAVAVCLPLARTVAAKGVLA
jgi:hypothetical protein